MNFLERTVAFLVISDKMPEKVVAPSFKVDILPIIFERAYKTIPFEAIPVIPPRRS